MPLRLMQIRVMTHYELRMLWRQRLLIVFTLSVLVLTGVLLTMFRGTASDQDEFASIEVNTITWITLIWPLLYLQLLLLSGLAVIDVMVRDRVWGVQAIQWCHAEEHCSAAKHLAPSSRDSSARKDVPQNDASGVST